jgi:hypothetical protein
MPTAVVVGAQGVIGRYIVDNLAALSDWNVIGLSRRKGADAARVKHISVDLLDLADAKAKLAPLKDVTHVFFAAFQPGSGPAADYAKNISANLALLANSVQAIDQASAKLERVVLVTGTKYYGSHLGPFKTPAKEDDPRLETASRRKGQSGPSSGAKCGGAHINCARPFGVANLRPACTTAPAAGLRTGPRRIASTSTSRFGQCANRRRFHSSGVPASARVSASPPVRRSSSAAKPCQMLSSWRAAPRGGTAGTDTRR